MGSSSIVIFNALTVLILYNDKLHAPADTSTILKVQEP